MQFDWNIEEIKELKNKVGVHSEDKAMKRTLEQLELHLVRHQNSRSFELRKKVWESVEDSATKLDSMLETPK